MTSSKESIQSNILNINPEPIGIYLLPPKEHEKYKKILYSLWEDVATSYRQRRDSHTNHICNAPSQNLFDDFEQLSELKQVMKSILRKYISMIGNNCDDIVIHSSWLNRADKGAVLSDHAHSNSFVSANYFVNFNKSVHTPLAFRNDRYHSCQNHYAPYFTIEESIEKNIYNSPRVVMNTQEGSILVWRSHMIHGYRTPNSESGRMTLSMNALPKTVSNGIYSFHIASESFG